MMKITATNKRISDEYGGHRSTCEFTVMQKTKCKVSLASTRKT